MMNLLDLQALEIKVKDLSAKINPPKEFIPTFGYTIDNGLPHIEVDSNNYHFVIIERGSEMERKTTHDLKQILYWIFEAITFSMALRYELNNRIPGQDSRIILFEKQISLITNIDGFFGQQLRREIEQILKIAPYTKPPDFI